MQQWYKPSQIAKQGLIKSPSNSDAYITNYRYVIRAIKSGRLKAKVWAEYGADTEGSNKRPYYVVHIDDIKAFNK